MFTSTTGLPLRHNLFYRRHFKVAVRAALPAELAGLRFHDLRHTCAALSIAAGAHPKLISARLGHSSITITLDRYGHLFPSVEEALAEKLDAAFAASVGMALRPHEHMFAYGGSARWTSGVAHIALNAGDVARFVDH